jgi:hypothetical protein
MQAQVELWQHVSVHPPLVCAGRPRDTYMAAAAAAAAVRSCCNALMGRSLSHMCHTNFAGPANKGFWGGGGGLAGDLIGKSKQTTRAARCPSRKFITSSRPRCNLHPSPHHDVHTRTWPMTHLVHLVICPTALTLDDRLGLSSNPVLG